MRKWEKTRWGSGLGYKEYRIWSYFCQKELDTKWYWGKICQSDGFEQIGEEWLCFKNVLKEANKYIDAEEKHKKEVKETIDNYLKK